MQRSALQDTKKMLLEKPSKRCHVRRHVNGFVEEFGQPLGDEAPRRWRPAIHHQSRMGAMVTGRAAGIVAWPMTGLVAGIVAWPTTGLVKLPCDLNTCAGARRDVAGDGLLIICSPGTDEGMTVYGCCGAEHSADPDACRRGTTDGGRALAEPDGAMQPCAGCRTGVGGRLGEPVAEAEAVHELPACGEAGEATWPS